MKFESEYRICIGFFLSMDIRLDFITYSQGFSILHRYGNSGGCLIGSLHIRENCVDTGGREVLIVILYSTANIMGSDFLFISLKADFICVYVQAWKPNEMRLHLSREFDTQQTFYVMSMTKHNFNQCFHGCLF
jgi:hypothetical protein